VTIAWNHHKRHRFKKRSHEEGKGELKLEVKESNTGGIQKKGKGTPESLEGGRGETQKGKAVGGKSSSRGPMKVLFKDKGQVVNRIVMIVLRR